ncbi:MAG: protein-L-isoaspartate(D-aspartate) O-methyltransferase [Candidatus Argoarchaeum ethanivorans]|uniref:Protein-L-isoaspartate O-methyltransferase n=1 Tax=Candidatus Argoarchaeum ethanivorans TaxID=2608793 RepID=A0A8B3S077_9EURY|nr:MAG: protein-L-isoaspartate(D-aspartate) O-methyltransferase [Candidatus Argoarchaeum ethanivorans]
MEFSRKRTRLVDGLKYHGIDRRVLDAMNRVPRHIFVLDSQKEYAYQDTPLSIGSGQTISAPHMVAIMCNLLDLEEGMSVLEIGTGSGYHVAVIAELVGKTGHVYTVERIEQLAYFARDNLKKTGYANVTVIIEDGSLGLPEYAPYDRISVAAAAPKVPQTLIDQLKEGGKMVIPVGSFPQELFLVTKNIEVTMVKKGGVSFVPLKGKYGF